MPHRRLWAWILAAAIAAGLSVSAQAAIPWMINYQGRLTDTSGSAITGTLTLTFRLYDASTSGTEVWEEEQTVTLSDSDNGVFNVVLGSVTELDSVDFNTPLWLSLQVSDDSEMTPRQRLTATGYALNADQIDGLDSAKFLRTDVDTSASGKLTLTKAGAAFVITPSSAPSANTKMIDVQSTSGTSKFSVDYEGDVTVAGDLTVSGTIGGAASTPGTTSTTWTVDNDNTSGGEPASGAGLVIEGGSGDASLLWDATNDELDVNKTTNITGTLKLSGSTSGYVGLAPAAAAGSTTYTLPSADATVSGQVLSSNAAGALSWATVDTSSSDDAPASASYLTLSTDATLSAERVLTEGSYLDFTDAGAGNTLTIAFDPTEVGSVTWAAADGAWTFDASTGTDPTIGWSNGAFDVDATVTVDDLVCETPGCIGATELGTDSVSTDEIATDAVGAAEIATNAVGSDEIATDAVGAAEIATDAVGGDEIAAGAVGASELAVSGVTAATYGSATAVPQIAIDEDGRVTSASDVTISINSSNIANNSLDFAKFEDTLDLDANLTLNQAGYTWTQSYTGSTGTAFDYTATSLTAGTAFDLNATNTATSDAAIQQMRLDLTNAQATAANSDFAGFGINFTNNPSVAGNTEVAMRIQHPVTTNTTDNLVSALLLLENIDTAASGSTKITDALRIQAATDTFITDALDASDPEIDNAINIGANAIAGTNFAVSTAGQISSGASAGSQAGSLLFYDDDVSSPESITVNAAAGADLSSSAVLTLPTTTGTFAVSASSPLSLNATTGVISCPTCSISSGTAPIDAEYIVSATNGTLTDEDVFTDGLAIDSTNAAGTFTVAFDPTELLGSRTWGDASTDTIVWTWNRNSGTDVTMTIADGAANFNGLQLGGTTVSVSGHAHAAGDITSGALDAARGGTGIDSSASTGIATITSGTWSATSTTGSGNVVLATSPTITTPTVSGNITYSGTQPKRTLILTAAGAIAAPSSGNADQRRVDGTNFSYYALNFDQSTDEKTFWQFAVPDSLTASSDITVTLFWTSTAGSAGQKVDWEVSTGATTDDDVFDAALGTATTINDTLIATGDTHVTSAGTISAANNGWAAGELAVFKVNRDADDGTNDTLAADARLLMVKIEWTAAAESD